MKSDGNWFEKENYKAVKFQVSKTKHLLIKVKINGVSGVFILDTGASTSCIGFEAVEKFGLKPQKSKIKAAGAGATGMFTQISKNNKIQIGRWKLLDFKIVIFDMSHVNEALIAHKSKAIDGIIGADILMKGNAIIDYKTQYFYLLE